MPGMATFLLALVGTAAALSTYLMWAEWEMYGDW